MLKIRLQRVGRRNDPSFRIVLTDSKNSTKSGKFLEVLGHYDFRKGKNKDNHIDAERVKHLISKGAKPSDTAHNLFVSYKILSVPKINALPSRKPLKEDKALVEKAAAAVEDKGVGSEEKKEVAEGAGEKARSYFK